MLDTSTWSHLVRKAGNSETELLWYVTQLLKAPNSTGRLVLVVA